MRTEFDRELEERLVRYAAIDTQSDEDSSSAPSTAIQLELQQLLAAELTEMAALVGSGAKAVREGRGLSHDHFHRQGWGTRFEIVSSDQRHRLPIAVTEANRVIMRRPL